MLAERHISTLGAPIAVVGQVQVASLLGWVNTFTIVFFSHEEGFTMSST